MCAIACFSFIFHPESAFLAAPDSYFCASLFACVLESAFLTAQDSYLVLFGYICMRLPRRRVYIICPIGHSIPTVTYRHI